MGKNGWILCAWLVACGDSAASSSGAGGAGGGSGVGASTSLTTGGQSTGGQSTGGQAASGGAGGGIAGDPCEGVGDGEHCGAELGGLADHGSRYTCLAGVTASVTPCPSGCAEGLCNEPASDPCSSAQFGDGAYCGGSLLGGDAGRLYHCVAGVTASSEACSAGCQVQPPGIADSCKPTGDPCVGAASGDGPYCGASLGGGDPNTLYVCQGQATASATVCTNGCQVMPPGVADVCAPSSNACCVHEPPGALTQAYSACGGGGQHYGRDYGTAIGTPIYAGIGGTVVGSALGFPNCYNGGCSASCWNSFNYVKIRSDCGDPADPARDLFLYYLHIDDLAPGVGMGSHVDQGQLVALSGDSGCSSGPHIHIETVSVPSGQSATLNTCNSVDPATRFCP